jgi:hypothetical protein
MPYVGKKFGIYGETYGLIWSNEPLAINSPLPDSAQLGLTVCGFWRAGATEIAKAFVEILRIAVRKSRDFEPVGINDPIPAPLGSLRSHGNGSELDWRHGPRPQRAIAHTADGALRA